MDSGEQMSLKKREELAKVAAVVKEVEAGGGKLRSTPGADRYNDPIVSEIQRRLAEQNN